MTSSHDRYRNERDALRNELSARADDLAFLDALRAFLADDWRGQYTLAPQLAAALGVDPARVYLDIRKGEIHLVIRADGEGGERWDDYARGRAGDTGCTCKNLDHHGAQQ